jgi:hypothetical protein
MQKLNVLVESGDTKVMCYLIGGIVGIFLMLYFMMSSKS